jgi:flagellin-like hook-associated protein FlgL
MVQISTGLGGRLSTVESSVAGAGRVAEAVSAVTLGGGGFSGGGGADVERDHQHLAASGKFVAEEKARAVASANAVEATSLLQIADQALASVRDKLDRLAELALTAEDSRLATIDRAQMDIEFQIVKNEIDAIAADTSFNKIKLLQGGSGTAGAFEISFKVGTGNQPGDDIVVSIAPASVSDLSAGLDVGSVTSMVGAATSRTNITAARDVLDVIRSGIAGDMARFSIASLNNSVISRGLNETRDILTSPRVVIDLAQLVARRAAEDGGYSLDGRTVDQLRKLLINLSIPNTGTDQPKAAEIGRPSGDSGGNIGGAPVTTSQDGAGTKDKDAA